MRGWKNGLNWVKNIRRRVLIFELSERWLSGRKRSPAKRLSALKGASRVQIPPSPPELSKIFFFSVIASLSKAGAATSSFFLK